MKLGRRAFAESAESPRLGWSLTVLHQRMWLFDLSLEWHKIAEST